MEKWERGKREIRVERDWVEELILARGRVFACFFLERKGERTAVGSAAVTGFWLVGSFFCKEKWRRDGRRGLRVKE